MKPLVVGACMAFTGTAAMADYSSSNAALFCLFSGVGIEMIEDGVVTDGGEVALQATNSTNLALSSLALEATFEGGGDPRDAHIIIWQLPSVLLPGEAMSGHIDAPDGAGRMLRVNVGNALDQNGDRVVEREAFYGSMVVIWPGLVVSQTVCTEQNK